MVRTGIDFVEKSFNRGFASFGTICPLACNHCYTFMKGYNTPKNDNINDIISSLKDDFYDIIYVSGHCENFINPMIGIELCEKLFDKFSSHIMITTRMIFNDTEIARLKRLQTKMNIADKRLFVCSSIPAFDSYRKLEPSALTPSPADRLNFLQRLYSEGFYTFLTLRPLFPNYYIPIKELLNIIELAKDYTSVVLSSGVVVSADNVEKLEGFSRQEKYGETLMNCLHNPDVKVQHVDVSKELSEINKKCNEFNIPMFNESLVAVRYLLMFENNNSTKKHFKIFSDYVQAINGDFKNLDKIINLNNSVNKNFWVNLKKEFV